MFFYLFYFNQLQLKLSSFTLLFPFPFSYTITPHSPSKSSTPAAWAADGTNCNDSISRKFSILFNLYEVTSNMKQIEVEQSKPKCKCRLRLQYLAGNAQQIEIARNFKLSQWTISECIYRVCESQNNKRREFIYFPNQHELDRIKLSLYKKRVDQDCLVFPVCIRIFQLSAILYSLFEGVIDCIHIHVTSFVTRNRTREYVNRKDKRHSINVQCIVDDRYRLMNLVTGPVGNHEELYSTNERCMEFVRTTAGCYQWHYSRRQRLSNSPIAHDAIRQSDSRCATTIQWCAIISSCWAIQRTMEASINDTSNRNLCSNRAYECHHRVECSDLSLGAELWMTRTISDRRQDAGRCVDESMRIADDDYWYY